MNILNIINLAGLFFVLGWILSRYISEKEINELKDACSYYYHQYKELKPKKRGNKWDV